MKKTKLAVPFVADDVLAAAGVAWGKLSKRQQLSVLHDIVETQGPDLVQRFPDALAVSYGFRAVGNTRSVREVRYDEPVLGFLVASKREARNAVERERVLPPVVLVNWEVEENNRQLLAIPTDVDSLRVIGVQAQNVRIRASVNNKTERGMLTAVVDLPGQAGQLYGLSCLHVIGMTAEFGNRPPAGISVAEDRTTTQVGELSRYRGQLKANAPDNFDGALARLDGPLHAIQPHVTQRYNAVLQEPLRLAVDYPSYVVYGKEGRKIEVKFSKRWRTFPIAYDGLGSIVHPWVIQSEVVSGGPTVGGDSGAPVLGKNGRHFLGMHIAGDLGKLAFMIAAPDVLAARNYGNFPPGDRLVIQTNF